MASTNKNNKNKQQKGSTQVNTTKKSTSNDKKSKKKQESTGCSCLPWLFGIFIVLGGIIGLLAYDVSQNGGGVFESKCNSPLGA